MDRPGPGRMRRPGALHRRGTRQAGTAEGVLVKTSGGTSRLDMPALRAGKVLHLRGGKAEGAAGRRTVDATNVPWERWRAPAGLTVKRAYYTATACRRLVERRFMTGTIPSGVHRSDASPRRERKGTL